MLRTTDGETETSAGYTRAPLLDSHRAENPHSRGRENMQRRPYSMAKENEKGTSSKVQTILWEHTHRWK